MTSPLDELINTNPLDELASICHRLPLWALEDLNRRIGDWLASGGKEDDPYIEQQLRFARGFVTEGE